MYNNAKTVLLEPKGSVDIGRRANVELHAWLPHQDSCSHMSHT